MKNKNYLITFIICLIITSFFLFPYIINNKLPLEHDTLFHLSRIEGYANALNHYDFIPRIYPLKNDGFGYASPLFYCDIFLLFPSLMYNLGFSLTTSYKFLIFFSTLFSCLSMYLLVHTITRNKYSAIISTIAYTFSNYHISDVYVRSSLGEILALIFFPLVLLGIYELFYTNKPKYIYLIIGFSGLLLSHNISFLLGVILFGIFIFINFKKIIYNKNILKYILFSTIITILICSFYLLPMLEMFFSDKLFVNYYSYSKYLIDSALQPWQFFTNKTVFGLGFTYNEKIMLVNIGWFLTFISTLYLFFKKKDSFILTCLIISYIFIFLTSNFIPWQYLGFLSIIQFTWRLNLIPLTLLPLVASVTITKLKKYVLNIIIIILFIECFVHIYPVLNRTFTIDNNTTYSTILSNEVIDPYYAATYVRTELAGGEYLPINTPNIEEYGTCIKDGNYNIITCEYVKDYDTLYFDINYEGNVILPITYYKGYQIYQIVDENKIEIDTFKSKNDLVSFYSNGLNSYICTYNKTIIQRFSIYISIFSIIAFIFYESKLHITNKKC